MPPSASWIRPGWSRAFGRRLTDYAAAGHGVGVFLGRHAQPVEAFNSPAAQQLLPGKLAEQVPREDGETYLAPQTIQNSILKPFALVRHALALALVSRLSLLAGGDDLNGRSKIISYNDGRPMLLQRTDRHRANRRAECS